MAKGRAIVRLALLGALTLGAGCVTTRRYPVVPLPVQLVSPTPFFAHVRTRADTAAPYCAVLRITGTVAEVRGDTIEFTAVWSDRRPRWAGDCLEGRPGYVVLSTAPAVRAETTIAPRGRLLGIFILVVPVAALLGVLLVGLG